MRGAGKIVAAFLCLLFCASASAALTKTIINDVTELNPIGVELVRTPESIADVQRLVAEHNGPISIGGGRFSQGGQIACDGCLFLDMRGMDRILEIDERHQTISVQPGVTWRKIQEAVDPKNLSPKIMQSYSNFTVGGSLSVNCHGDYVGLGPIVSSVSAIKLVMADGSLRTASRIENYELFRAAIGGYGGIGVIVEVTLDLAKNEALERKSLRLKAEQYPEWHRRNVARSSTAVLHYAVLYPPDYRTVNAVTSSATTKPVTIQDRLAPQQKANWFERILIAQVSHGPFGKSFRRHIVDPWTENRTIVNWRNYDAASDALALEPKSRAKSTYVLQEYFIPEANYDAFRKDMSVILRENKVNVLNIAIRHAVADKETYLSWAPEDVFAFVIYYEQGTSQKAKDHVRSWTSKLIKAAIKNGGRHYLPYQIVATRDEFQTEYPGAKEYFSLKARVDPTYKFRNKLWDAYYR